jgi:hypothetical protein
VEGRAAPTVADEDDHGDRPCIGRRSSHRLGARSCTSTHGVGHGQRPAGKTVKEARNKRYILNQDTFVSRVNSATTRYSGAALASSFENGELYTNIDAGSSVDQPCGYRRR